MYVVEEKQGRGTISKRLLFFFIKKKKKVKRKAVLTSYPRAVSLSLGLGIAKGKRLLHAAQHWQSNSDASIPALMDTSALGYMLGLPSGPALCKAGCTWRQGQAVKLLCMMSFPRFWIFFFQYKVEMVSIFQRTVHRSLSEEGSDTSPAGEHLPAKI